MVMGAKPHIVYISIDIAYIQKSFDCDTSYGYFGSESKIYSTSNKILWRQFQFKTYFYLKI